MKKIGYLILTLLITLLITPVVFAKGNVEIKSIDLEAKSVNVDENSKPTFKGLEMNFDLTFKKQGDYAKYEVVIKNNSDVDFQISEDTSFNTSKYITYKYDVEKVLKAKGETTVHVTITYEKEVPENLLASGKYSENNQAVVQLLNEEGEAVNPNTYQGISIVVIILFLASIVVAIVLNKQDFVRYGLFVLIGLCLIPILVSAIETLKLTINVDIEIKKAYEVAYILDEGLVKYSERNNFDLSRSSCRKTYYIGEKNNTNRYEYCFDVIKKESKVYSKGERIDLQVSTDLYKIKTINEDTGEEYCELQDDGTYSCVANTPIESKRMALWTYGKANADDFGYGFDESDFETMAFEDMDDSEYSYTHKMILSAPQKFTMPDHSVVFDTYKMR